VKWREVYDGVLPYVVSIETPEGSGTGFLFAYNELKTFVAIATAAHVVEHADDWKLPIKIRHHVSGQEVFLLDEDRYIERDDRRDSASVLFKKGTIPWPAEVLPMIDSKMFVPIGSEVGWVGYPGIARPYLCFFTGPISAFMSPEDSYLIDGVAINGVSGGPVFRPGPQDGIQLIGTISAYMPNRIRGDALPGLMRAQDVTSFQDTVRTIRSLDEARRKQEEEKKKVEEKKAAEEQAGPEGKVEEKGEGKTEGTA
jgi:hypothetical protein